MAVARTRRLPTFQTEATASQLLTPVDFAFPQGAFGDFPGIGPIPSADTTVSVPRQPTYYLSSQVSQPISQLFRIGLGIKSAAATRDIERERTRAQRLSVINNVKRLYFAILQTQSALASNNESIALYRELDRTLQVRVTQQVSLRSDALDVQFRLAQEELSRTTLQNALASQKEQLNQLLGRDVRTHVRCGGCRAGVNARGRRRGRPHARAREPARCEGSAAEARAGRAGQAHHESRTPSRRELRRLLQLEFQHRRPAHQSRDRWCSGEVGALRLGPPEPARSRPRATPSIRRAWLFAMPKTGPCWRSTACPARSPKRRRFFASCKRRRARRARRCA